MSDSIRHTSALLLVGAVQANSLNAANREACDTCGAVFTTSMDNVPTNRQSHLLRSNLLVCKSIKTIPSTHAPPILSALTNSPRTASKPQQP
ncbi:hypothetical protein BU25DRAFT_406590 [Macroventuria anomochaeta]|uniref:Uncharacterized protein n=1 Tax=Macroventuria anomochaeta TaxID=301207 RepID=A0ACB6SCP8_9PLEO|nr:uncharacterized protein BU25DRAFT_406590 [Macroventuria anomochaeta]KAF2632076.1 hypothetical protein BU25DRAFT_406590 [Macroventuria anomochaeta]